MRKFNTEGSIIAEDHYFILPLERMNRGELLQPGVAVSQTTVFGR